MILYLSKILYFTIWFKTFLIINLNALTVRSHNRICTEKANCNIDERKDNHIKEKTSIFNVTIVMQRTQSGGSYWLRIELSANQILDIRTRIESISLERFASHGIFTSENLRCSKIKKGTSRDSSGTSFSRTSISAKIDVSSKWAVLLMLPVGILVIGCFGTVPWIWNWKRSFVQHFVLFQFNVLKLQGIFYILVMK